MLAIAVHIVLGDVIDHCAKLFVPGVARVRGSERSVASVFTCIQSIPLHLCVLYALAQYRIDFS